MRSLSVILALVCSPLHAADAQWDLLVPAQSVPEASLLDRAEALDTVAVEEIMEEAYAAIGCALPIDLVSVFEVFLVDRVMMALGDPVGPEVAQQGFFALRLRSTTIHHPEARAVLAAARAVDGRLNDAIRSGRMAQRTGLFHVADCEPEGTLFALSPYATQ